ncbi:MAG: glycerophosphoryl diester phosphodiesterase membrane domain-containing protein [Verrucomicrobiae bacterium]|nr:glycerophosphoryl diester phosphodiesterase membrane domain-containing protein [Verrucomicrobiae bacterium]MDW8342913.1 GYF domain-containing protein [Verrucomicrobiae bacterium]
MYRVIGGDGREYGPVELPVLEQWIREGRVNSQSQVRREADANWQPASAFPELRPALGLGASAATTAPPMPAAAPTGTPPGVVRAGACVSAAWRLYQQNFGTLFLGMLIFSLITVALGVVPFVGGVAQLVLTGPLTGGVYWLFLQRIRGRPAGVAEVFSGFQRGFVQLMLCHIVTSLLVLLCSLPGLLLVIPAIFLGILNRNPEPLAIVLVVLGGLYILAVVVYLTVCWLFALPLVMDKQMEFWPAMKLSRQRVHAQWWRVFGLLVLSALVVSLGLLLCGVGILLTLPIGTAAVMYAYEQLFADVSAPSATA